MSFGEHFKKHMGKYGGITAICTVLGVTIPTIYFSRDNSQNSPRNIVTQVNSIPVSSDSQKINSNIITLQELVINRTSYVATPIPEGYVASSEGKELPIEKGRFSLKETKNITIDLEPSKTPSIIESQFTEQYILVRASMNDNKWNIDPNTKHGDLASVVNSRTLNVKTDSTGKHSQTSNYEIPASDLPKVKIGNENYFLIECITPDHHKDLDVILMPTSQTTISHRITNNNEGISFISDVLKGPVYMVNLVEINQAPKKEEKKKDTPDSRPIKLESIEPVPNSAENLK